MIVNPFGKDDNALLSFVITEEERKETGLWNSTTYRRLYAATTTVSF